MPPRALALPLSLAFVLGGVGCGVDELVDSDLGDAPRCAEVDRWPVGSADAEQDLLDAIDDLRRAGAECGGETLAGVGPLEPIPELQCAARLHAGDLIRHADLEIDHEGSDGSSALARANSAGYDGITRQELLAGDFVGAQQLVDAWLGDEPRCRAMLDSSVDHIGAAQAQTRAGDRIVWVVVTGEERR